MTLYRVGEILIDNENGHISQHLVVAYLGSEYQAMLERKYGSPTGWNLMKEWCDKWEIDTENPMLPGWMRIRRDATAHAQEIDYLHDLQETIVDAINDLLGRGGKFLGIPPDHPGVWAIMSLEDDGE